MKKKNSYYIAGVTFIEAVTTIAIVTASLIFLYKAMLISLDYQEHLSRRLYAHHLLSYKLTKIEYDYQAVADFPLGPRGEVIKTILNNKAVSFYLTWEPSVISDYPGILKLNVSLSWPERGRTFSLRRAVYIAKN